MALTRKLLKGMGLTDEQVDTIIEAHTDTVDGLKTDIEKYKGDAAKLPTVQKELDDLKAAGDGGYKEKYEKEHSDFAKYKADQEAKEAVAKKTNAYTALLKAAGFSEKGIRTILKVTDLNSVDLEGDAVKDAQTITEGLKTEWPEYIETSTTTGATTSTPPANNPGSDKDLGSLSMEDYIKERNKK